MFENSKLNTTKVLKAADKAVAPLTNISVNLAHANHDISVLIEQKNQEIAQAQEEIKQLNTKLETNRKVIDGLAAFL